MCFLGGLNCLFSLYELSPCYAWQLTFNLKDIMAFVICPILKRQSKIHWFNIVLAICISVKFLVMLSIFACEFLVCVCTKIMLYFVLTSRFSCYTSACTLLCLWFNCVVFCCLTGRELMILMTLQYVVLLLVWFYQYVKYNSKSISV